MHIQRDPQAYNLHNLQNKDVPSNTGNNGGVEETGNTGNVGGVDGVGNVDDVVETGGSTGVGETGGVTETPSKQTHGYKIDFEALNLTTPDGEPIKSYADYFGQDIGKPNAKPYYRLGGESFFPAHVKTHEEREAFVESKLVPYSRKSLTDGRHGFAEVLGGLKANGSSVVAAQSSARAEEPNFFIGGGIYGSDHLNTPLDPNEIIAKVAEGPEAFGQYMQQNMQDLLTHWPFSHTFRVTVQNPDGEGAVATQNSAPPSYMGNGNFDSGGDYQNILLYEMKSQPIEVKGRKFELSADQLKNLKAASAAVDNLVSQASSVIGFNGNYEGGMTLDKATEVQSMAGLMYLLSCGEGVDGVPDQATIREQLTNGPLKNEWKMFCAMGGAATPTMAAIAPPTPSGIRAALKQAAKDCPSLNLPEPTPVMVKKLYDAFWNKTNAGEMVNNGNAASETFRWTPLKDSDLKPINEMLADNAGLRQPLDINDFPENGLPLPRMTVVDYVGVNVARQLPMDYTQLTADDAKNVQARIAVAMAVAPEVMKRAGLNDEQVGELQQKFAAGLEELKEGLKQSATADGEDAARQILDPIMEKLSALALESNEITGARQALAWPPGAFQWVADRSAHQTTDRHGYLALEISAIGVDESVISQAS